jgi:hypothetical protein
MTGRAALYGRDPLLRALVPQLTGLAYGRRARVRWKPTPDPPVVLVVGQHGMGRSAVLEDLAAEYTDTRGRPRLPLAHVRATPADQGLPVSEQPSEVPYTAGSLVELLQELACGIADGLKSRRPFRVLVPGLFAVSHWRPDDGDERDAVCLRLARLLIACGHSRANAGALARSWADDVESALKGVQGDDRPRKMAKALIEKYAKSYPVGRAQVWYGQQRGQGTARNTDKAATWWASSLVRLGTRFHEGGDHQRAAERTLVAAFLHDIAAAYGPLQRVNCEYPPLILLDDAHHPAGKRFIDLLLEHRVQPGRSQDDRLVVVATRLGGIPEDAADATRCELPQLADLIAESGWQHKRRSPSAGLLVVPLTPLTRDDVFSLLDRSDSTPHKFLASGVHSLLGGHPEASRMLCDAVLDATGKGQKVAPRTLLDLHTEDGRPITAALLERLIPEQRQRHRLVQLCLARDRTAAEALAGHLGMRGPEQLLANAAADYLEAHEWQPYAMPEGQLVAHPLLQTLLVAEARRTMGGNGGGGGKGNGGGASGNGGAESRWHDIHRFLVQHHLESDNKSLSNAHWHSLAAGESPKVAKALEERFEGGRGQRDGAGEWLELLAYCATAPVPPAGGGKDKRRDIAMAEYDSIAGEFTSQSDALKPVNRLLHALWCLSEPHGEPDPELCDVVSEELAGLALLHPAWRSELRHAAHTWRAAAKRRLPFTPPDKG